MNIRELRSLPELVSRSAVKFADAPSLTCSGATRDRLSYAGLNDHMHRAATFLRGLDLPRGARVALAAQARPQWVAALLGILKAGLVAVPVPEDTDPQAALAINAHARTAAVIVSPRTRHLVDQQTDSHVITIDTLFEVEARAPGSFGEPCDLALLAFTSGSTQQPRAVELTHANLLSNVDALLQARSGAPDAVMLSMLPPAHLFQLVVGLLAPLACGAQVVFCDALLPNRVIDIIRGERITHALAVPALLGCLVEEVTSQLIEAGSLAAEYADYSLAEQAVARLQTDPDAAERKRLKQLARSRIGDSFQSFVVGGAAIDPALARIVRAAGIGVDVGYGLTEAGPVVSLGVSGECPPRSVGRPLPGVNVRIAPGGEILVRGPSIARGYFRDCDATAAALAGGWLKTGDRGFLDSAGHLFITGRLKEAMVTSAGETIYPEEVEPYYRHTLFAEQCVVGLPDCDGNDCPTLFVVPTSDQVADDQLHAAFAQLRAAAPRRLRVQHMIRLPGPLSRTASGKIRRGALAEQYRPRD